MHCFEAKTLIEKWLHKQDNMFYLFRRESNDRHYFYWSGTLQNLIDLSSYLNISADKIDINSTWDGCEIECTITDDDWVKIYEHIRDNHDNTIQEGRSPEE